MDHRKIIHIDMDAFFASVEQRDFPELRNKPIAVGGGGERGVIAAASYEARKYGVKSAMPGKIALKMCPNLIFVKHRFDVYKEVSKQIREIFSEYTDLVEPLSLDEAFLDVTQNHINEQSAILIASMIKEDVFKKTHLTASAGVSINKFLAKTASDLKKPNGLAVILPEQVEPFLAELPIDHFFGVGQSFARRLKNHGIHTGTDLKSKDKIWLAKKFGKLGLYLYQVVRGIDNREVKPNRVRKSVSSEKTFSHNLNTKLEIKQEIKKLITKTCRTCKKHHIKGKTINLKYRYHDFQTFTRSHTVGSYINDEDTIYSIVLDLVEDIPEDFLPIRLLGVGLSSLNTLENSYQLEIDFGLLKNDTN